MKIVKSLEDSILLIKTISETIKIEVKELKRRLLLILFGRLGASIIVNGS